MLNCIEWYRKCCIVSVANRRVVVVVVMRLLLSSRNNMCSQNAKTNAKSHHPKDDTIRRLREYSRAQSETSLTWCFSKCCNLFDKRKVVLP